jgi:hypothetical protein
LAEKVDFVCELADLVVVRVALHLGLQWCEVFDEAW